MPSGILQHDAATTTTNTNARYSQRNTYPDAVALREALQNPAANLCADLDLNHATVAQDRNGFPLVFTGRFAVVFRLHLPGNIPVALRLFTSAEKEFYGERAERLRRTTEILRNHQAELGNLLPPPVYLPEAVRVAGAWYPAQVLPWAEGDALTVFVERHRKSSDTLRTLAQTISDAALRMEAAGVTHGDLQHDNILVSDNGQRITLVDYDALYAPELRDLAPPAERGHRHYQHPGRTIAHYGIGTDRFAAAAISTGLRMVANDSTLWDRFDGGTGECILFTETDFRLPQISPLFAIAREQAKLDTALAGDLQTLEQLLRAPEPVLEVTATITASTVARKHPVRRPPARVTPTCEEERVHPHSYLSPLYTPGFRRADRANAFALRAYCVIVPPIVALTWSAAWEDGGAKWTFLEYLFVVSTVLLFVFLYLTWGLKQQHDALGMELGKLRLIQEHNKERKRHLEQRLQRVGIRPPDERHAQSYRMQALAQIPISRAIGDYGVSPDAVRVLRERGIQSAAQLWRRHGFFPGEIRSADAELLRAWLQDEEELAQKQFVRETQPERRLQEEIDALEASTARAEKRVIALRAEWDQFPDASLRSFVRRISLPLSPREGNALICSE